MIRAFACLVVVALASCRGAREKAGEDAKPAPDPETAAVPFAVKGKPVVTDAPADPEAAWRFLVSQVTDRRAEARAVRQDILLTFEPRAFHVPQRSGARRTFVLPERLVLQGGVVQLLIRADLTCEVWGPAGPKSQDSGEIAVVRGRLADGAGNVREFRLTVKGGREFRSIETAG